MRLISVVPSVTVWLPHLQLRRFPTVSAQSLAPTTWPRSASLAEYFHFLLRCRAADSLAMTTPSDPISTLMGTAPSWRSVSASCRAAAELEWSPSRRWRSPQSRLAVVYITMWDMTSSGALWRHELSHYVIQVRYEVIMCFVRDVIKVSTSKLRTPCEIMRTSFKVKSSNV